MWGWSHVTLCVSEACTLFCQDKVRSTINRMHFRVLASFFQIIKWLICSSFFHFQPFKSLLHSPFHKHIKVVAKIKISTSVADMTGMHCRMCSQLSLELMTTFLVSSLRLHDQITMWDLANGKLLRTITDAHPPGTAILHVKVHAHTHTCKVSFVLLLSPNVTPPLLLLRKHL